MAVFVEWRDNQTSGAPEFPRDVRAKEGMAGIVWDPPTAP